MIPGLNKTQNHLKKLVAHDNEAWREVFEEYYPKLLYWFRFYKNSPIFIEDLVQETFLQLYRNINKLEDPKKFSSWVYSIAKSNLYHNLSNHHLKFCTREDKSENWVVNKNLLTKSAEDEIKDDLIRSLEQAILKLSPKQREVIQLYYMNGMSLKEISKVIGSNVNYTSVLLYRGRKKLHSLIKSGKLK